MDPDQLAQVLNYGSRTLIEQSEQVDQVGDLLRRSASDLDFTRTRVASVTEDVDSIGRGVGSARTQLADSVAGIELALRHVQTAAAVVGQAGAIVHLAELDPPALAAVEALSAALREVTHSLEAARHQAAGSDQAMENVGEPLTSVQRTLEETSPPLAAAADTLHQSADSLRSQGRHLVDTADTARAAATRISYGEMGY